MSYEPETPKAGIVTEYARGEPERLPHERLPRAGATPVPSPTPEPTPAPVPAPASTIVAVNPIGAGFYDDLFCSYPWDCYTALRVFHCENRAANPAAISYTGDYGLTQINRRTWLLWLSQHGFNFDAEWMIPEKNIAMAYTIWLDGGNTLKQSFHHWNCY